MVGRPNLLIDNHYREDVYKRQEFIHQLQVANLLFAFGLAGMIFGSLYALRERNVKRLLAYSLSLIHI